MVGVRGFTQVSVPYTAQFKKTGPSGVKACFFELVGVRGFTPDILSSALRASAASGGAVRHRSRRCREPWLRFHIAAQFKKTGHSGV